MTVQVQNTILNTRTVISYEIVDLCAIFQGDMMEKDGDEETDGGGGQQSNNITNNTQENNNREKGMIYFLFCNLNVHYFTTCDFFQ